MPNPEGHEGFEHTESIWNNLKEQHPEKNVVHSAIRTLRSEQDIEKFFQEYVEQLKVELAGREDDRDPVEVARSNVAYLLAGYNDNEIDARWDAVLQGAYEHNFGKPTSSLRKPLREGRG
jgi:hypothetical protein